VEELKSGACRYFRHRRLTRGSMSRKRHSARIFKGICQFPQRQVSSAFLHFHRHSSLISPAFSMLTEGIPSFFAISSKALSAETSLSALERTHATIWTASP